MVEYFALGLYLNIVFISVYLIKIKVLTYTSYKKHCDLYTEIHVSIAVNSCQIRLPQKNIVLLSEVSRVTYKAGKCTRVESTKFVHFNLSASTYSIEPFNAKIKVAILQQRQYWQPPQIKDLKLSYQKTIHSWPPIIFLIALGIPTTILKRLRKSGEIYPLVHTKHLLIHHLLQYHCHCAVSTYTKLKKS